MISPYLFFYSRHFVLFVLSGRRKQRPCGGRGGGAAQVSGGYVYMHSLRPAYNTFSAASAPPSAPPSPAGGAVATVASAPLKNPARRWRSAPREAWRGTQSSLASSSFSCFPYVGLNSVGLSQLGLFRFDNSNKQYIFDKTRSNWIRLDQGVGFRASGQRFIV